MSAKDHNTLPVGEEHRSSIITFLQRQQEPEIQDSLLNVRNLRLYSFMFLNILKSQILLHMFLMPNCSDLLLQFCEGRQSLLQLLLQFLDFGIKYC